MEEDGEVAPDGEEPRVTKLVGTGADDDPVAVAPGPPDQRIAHGASHEIAFHPGSCDAGSRPARQPLDGYYSQRSTRRRGKPHVNLSAN
jgi:hypothetical protein